MLMSKGVYSGGLYSRGLMLGILRYLDLRISKFQLCLMKYSFFLYFCFGKHSSIIDTIVLIENINISAFCIVN